MAMLEGVPFQPPIGGVGAYLPDPNRTQAASWRVPQDMGVKPFGHKDNLARTTLT